MQTIADKSLALAVNTQTIVMSIVDGVKEGVKDRAERLRDEERGVAAVEYAGVLLIVGLIFAGIFALHLPTEVKKWANTVVENINNGSGCKGKEGSC
jgi:Flp pilus assembly pilin Flp